MGKLKNASGTEQVTLSLSEESVRVLRELAVLGIYGKNEAEVAGRFVDKALEPFIVAPRFKLPLRKQSRRAFVSGKSGTKQKKNQQGKRSTR
jgi:hypothetical protein